MADGSLFLAGCFFFFLVKTQHTLTVAEISPSGNFFYPVDYGQSWCWRCLINFGYHDEGNRQFWRWGESQIVTWMQTLIKENVSFWGAQQLSYASVLKVRDMWHPSIFKGVWTGYSRHIWVQPTDQYETPLEYFKTHTLQNSIKADSIRTIYTKKLQTQKLIIIISFGLREPEENFLRRNLEVLQARKPLSINVSKDNFSEFNISYLTFVERVFAWNH